MSQDQYIAIVHPYIDFDRTVEAFRARGIKCLALVDSAELSDYHQQRLKYQRYDATVFDATLEITTPLQDFSKQIKAFNLIGIITGCESGTAVTDQLNHILNFPTGNATALSAMRFDKFHTHQHLLEQGVTAIRQQILSFSHPEASHAIIDQFTYPAVIKPTQSGGSFGVFICQNRCDAHQAFKVLSQTIDPVFAKQHPECVIQEQFIGQEYVVDVVNFSGQHYIASINAYIKQTINHHPIVQGFRWVDPSSSDAQQIINYINQVLDAIAFDYGPAHVELFLTDEGPKLIEVNPRVSGASGYHNKLCRALTGKDQLDLLADVYLQQRITYHTPLSLHGQQGMTICLANPGKPAPLNRQVLSDIQSLKSFQEIRLNYEDMMPTTTDMFTLAGFVLLVHESASQLAEDVSALTDVWGASQGDGLY